jgi:hypothetical protein
MPSWKKTECCGTCALWDRSVPGEEAVERGGRYAAHTVAPCRWAPPEGLRLPFSIPFAVSQGLLEPRWTCRKDGNGCSCYVKRGD